MIRLDKSLSKFPQHLQDILEQIQPDNSSDYCLSWQDFQLQLQCPGMKPLICDFTQGEILYRAQSGGVRGELVVKAVNLKKYPNAQVIDATAGMGQDSFILAAVGCQVTLIERNPIVAALLADGLYRAKLHQDTAAIAERMQLKACSSHNYLTRMTSAADVIHLDPMFPERKKSAQVKKAMSVFHTLVGSDDDAAELLQIARQAPCKKIIVKRPGKAPFVGDITPSSQVKSKKHRYDIYLPTPR